MKKTLATITAALMSVGFAAIADESTQEAVMLTDTQMDMVVAGAAPETPGAFGRARSAGVQALTGKVWGAIAAERAGTNGDLNQAFKDANGGSPTPGAPAP
jgi:4-hydroxyphenylpyruvate dioxygenase-like putative hemolysin